MFCPKCGEKLPDDSEFCSACGEKIINVTHRVQKEPKAEDAYVSAAPATSIYIPKPDSVRIEKKAPGFCGVLFSVIFSLLLTVSVILLVLLLFIHALNENAIIPSIGPISSDWLEMFFGSWYSLVLGGTLVLIPILLIVLINKNRIRRFFLSIGCSAIASAILSIAAIIIKTQILKLLSGEWQDALINATAVFGDFCIVCAIVLIVIGAICLSIYSCIAAIKGGKHEKDN